MLSSSDLDGLLGEEAMISDEGVCSKFKYWKEVEMGVGSLCFGGAFIGPGSICIDAR